MYNKYHLIKEWYFFNGLITVKIKIMAKSKNLYKYFDIEIFTKLEHIKELSDEELLVLEEEMKNNKYFSQNKEMLSYLYREKSYRKFKKTCGLEDEKEIYMEFIKQYSKKKNDRKGGKRK